jgi:hypothetical protein
MRNLRLSIILVFSVVVLVISCKKKEETTPAVTAPTLKLAAPTENDQLLNGQILNIKGQVGDINGLHTLSIKIIDDKTSTILFQTTPSVLNEKNYALNTSWTVKVSDWTDATMIITAANHAGMKTEKTVKFKLWL